MQWITRGCGWHPRWLGYRPHRILTDLAASTAQLVYAAGHHQDGRRPAVFAVVLGAALLGTPTAHADPANDYLTTISQHGFRMRSYQDRQQGMVLGFEACDHLHDGLSPMAARRILRERDATEEQAEWVVQTAQITLCPDTLPPGE
jgi:hypothetical protein